MKLQEDLRSWGGLNLNATTDEDIGEISLAIKYHDHGDEFLHIRTYSEKEYEYGYWLNRNNYFEKFDPSKNDGQSDEWFIRRPILYRMPDEHAKYSNKILFIVHRYLEERNGFYSSGIQKCDSKTQAESILKQTIYAIKMVLSEADEKNIYYSMKDKICTDNLYRFAVLNELDQEYFNMIKELEIDSSINGYDGMAGKKESGHWISCDGVIQVIYRGKSFDIKKLCMSRGDVDKWGCETKHFNTKSLM